VIRVRPNRHLRLGGSKIAWSIDARKQRFPKPFDLHTMMIVVLQEFLEVRPRRHDFLADQKRGLPLLWRPIPQCRHQLQTRARELLDQDRLVGTGSGIICGKIVHRLGRRCERQPCILRDQRQTAGQREPVPEVQMRQALPDRPFPGSHRCEPSLIAETDQRSGPRAKRL
jgi:hypothetical protein